MSHGGSSGSKREGCSRTLEVRLEAGKPFLLPHSTHRNKSQASPRSRGRKHTTSGLEEPQNHIAVSVHTEEVENPSGPFFFFFLIYLLHEAGTLRIGSLPFCKASVGRAASILASFSLDSDPTKPVRPVLQSSFMLYSFGAQKTALIFPGQTNMWQLG